MQVFFLLCSIILMFSCCNRAAVTVLEDERRVDSLLLQASRLQDNVQLKRAADVYLDVIALAEQKQDSFAVLTALHRLGIVYRLQSFKEEALEMQERAWEWRESGAGDSLKGDILKEKARLHALQGRVDSASCYFRLALDWKEQTGIWQEWAALYENRKEYNRAIRLLQSALRRSDNGENGEVSDVSLSLCRLYLKQNMPDSAAFYLSHVQSLHPKNSYYQSEIARQRGDTVLATFHLNTYKREQYALSSHNDKEMLSRHLYSFQSKELSEAKKGEKSPRYWLMSLLLLPVPAVLVYLSVRKKKVPVSQDQSFRSSEIFFRFHRKEEWRPRSEDWETLFSSFNEAYPGFVERLKEQMATISQTDLQMCCLIKMDVAPSIIAQLLCCTNAAVSMKRSRLFQKLTGEKGTPEQCDRFIREI